MRVGSFAFANDHAGVPVWSSRVWDGVIGQDRALGVLDAAAARPGHAYLLVGAAGSGVLEAARLFAARLAVDGVPDARVVDLVRRGVYADVVEFEPEGTFFLTEQARAVLQEAARAPVEGERKVLLLHDVDRMNEASSSHLLKTIEEPPSRTAFVLVTARPDEVLETVRSRCQRIDFDALADDAVAAALTADGVDAAAALRGARLAGGHLARARALTGSWAAVHDVFAAAPTRVDGTGATAMTIVGEVEGALDEVARATEARHASELAAFDDEMERLGYEPRVAQARRRRLVERHKRELTRLRRDLLLEGVTAIESVHRDALARSDALDAPVPQVAAHAAARALDACRVAREALLANEKGGLHLLRLLLSLPTSGRTAVTG
jgi:DNA polymerase-3 subunit delta'